MRELFQPKQRFGVSAQGIAYRCKDLGIFGQSLFTQVFKVFNATGDEWLFPSPLTPLPAN